jgi:hypothetical protein
MWSGPPPPPPQVKLGQVSVSGQWRWVGPWMPITLTRLQSLMPQCCNRAIKSHLPCLALPSLCLWVEEGSYIPVCTPAKLRWLRAVTMKLWEPKRKCPKVVVFLKGHFTIVTEPGTITLQALSLVEKAEPVQVHFTLRSRDQHQWSMWMQGGCKVYMDSYMASNGSCFMVTWTIFRKPPLGGRPNTNPWDHGLQWDWTMCSKHKHHFKIKIYEILESLCHCFNRKRNLIVYNLLLKP